MASVAWQFYNQYREFGKVKLFSGTEGYADGEQMRDFVYIDDVVSLNTFILKNPNINGIFNVGTGRCQSFNEIALAVINCCSQNDNESQISLSEAVSTNKINYIPMPEALLGKYQSYTQADLTKLNSTGFNNSFDDAGSGVAKYISCLD